MSNTVLTRKVSSAKEYNELMKGASIMDLKVKKALFKGDWEAQNGEPLFINGIIKIVSVGRKYFKIKIQDGTYKCRPVNKWKRGKGQIVLSFKEK